MYKKEDKSLIFNFKRSIVSCCTLIMIFTNLVGQSEQPYLVSTKTQSVIGEVSSKMHRLTVKLIVKDNQEPKINQFQQWLVEIKDQSENPVFPAKIAISGGMPSHGHGLPTQPQVTDYLGDGLYLIEGIKFNMTGNWMIHLQILTPTIQDTATINFDVNY